MARSFDVSDSNTGEVVEQGYFRLEKPKYRHPYTKGWAYMNLDPESLDKIAKIKTITDLKVLMEMMKSLGYENEIRIYQKRVAEALGMQPSHVSTSIKNLIGVGLLHPDKDMRGVYTLDEALFYRGHLAKFPKKLEREARKAQAEDRKRQKETQAA